MKTHQLVKLLASDSTVLPAPGRTLGLAMIPAALLALVLFLWLLGVRPDLAAAVHSIRFDFKVLLNILLTVASCGLLLGLARPLAVGGNARRALWAVPVLLLLAVVIELTVLPREQWWAVARGRNATWCLRVIPALAMAPLLASLWSLRQAAPGRPVFAGAAAGLMSAGLAGSLYAMHCPDDSPLFVVLWYGLAIATVTALGAVLGSKLLRW